MIRFLGDLVDFDSRSLLTFLPSGTSFNMPSCRSVRRNASIEVSAGSGRDVLETHMRNLDVVPGGNIISADLNSETR